MNRYQSFLSEIVLVFITILAHLFSKFIINNFEIFLQLSYIESLNKFESMYKN